MSEPLTPAQRRTLPARQALAGKFASPEEKTAYFRNLAQRSHERRLVLSGDDAAVLLAAYTLLRQIAERAQSTTGPPTNPQDGATGTPPSQRRTLPR
jgi:hypothetical protein